MNQRTKAVIDKYGPLCGVIGPVVIGLGMLLSAVTYSGPMGEAYSPLNHFVSELGEVGVAELSVTFNWGLIIGGLITIPFMAYMAAQVKSWMRWPLGLIGVFSAVFGVLVGFYPMNYIEPHTFVALAFFQLGMLTCILYSLVILFSKRHPYARWLALPGLLYIVSFALFTFFPDLLPTNLDFEGAMGGYAANRPDVLALTILEWIMVLAILIWIFMMGVYLTWYGDRQAAVQRRDASPETVDQPHQA
ncbi:MAG: DUF998 domain-containing protein [Chloroflexota bacterium]|jgi:hypothetical membrane protein